MASITAAHVTDDGSIYLAGNSSPMFNTLASPKIVRPDPALLAEGGDSRNRGRAPAWGPVTHRGLTLAGNVYVARLTPDGKTIQWAWVFEGYREAPDRLWVADNGDVTFSSRGVQRISRNGTQHTQVFDRAASNTAGLLAVHPTDGSFLWGGDRNTNTGREPWRQPYMVWYDNQGQSRASLWGWDPKRVGTDQYRLVSDSSPRNAAFTAQGDLLISGWSDGGNSVFNRQPLELDKEAPGNASNFSTWGMKNANSLGWLMVIDAKSLEVTRRSQFVTYIPETFASARDRGAPNFVSIEALRLLDNDHIGFTGRAATGLIQTPHAFYKHPDDGRKSGGEYAAVYSADMKNLLFSSYLPGYQTTAIGYAPRGMVIVGRTVGHDNAPLPTTNQPTPTPTINALQSELAGGQDAHIILLAE